MLALLELKEQPSAMHLSIVIPVYDGAATLSRCLTALAHSDWAPDECIVIDDGSSDGSETIAACYGARPVSFREHRGPTHARNLGARLAKGDLLVACRRDNVTADAAGRIGIFPPDRLSVR